MCKYQIKSPSLEEHVGSLSLPSDMTSEGVHHHGYNNKQVVMFVEPSWTKETTLATGFTWAAAVSCVNVLCFVKPVVHPN